MGLPFLPSKCGLNVIGRSFGKIGICSPTGKPLSILTVRSRYLTIGMDVPTNSKLPDLMELEKRLQDAIFGVANPTLAIRQICQTCGDTVLGHELLRCGHVAYGESDAVQPVLGRKPRGATLDIRLTWGKPNNETTQAPGKMVLTRAGMRGLLKSMDAIDSQLPRLKCGCGNYAASDGYCRRCRATSGPESAT